MELSLVQHGLRGEGEVLFTHKLFFVKVLHCMGQYLTFGALFQVKGLLTATPHGVKCLETEAFHISIPLALRDK